MLDESPLKVVSVHSGSLTTVMGLALRQGLVAFFDLVDGLALGGTLVTV